MKLWLFGAVVASLAGISTGKTAPVQHWKLVETVSRSPHGVLVMSATNLSQRPGNPIARLSGVEINMDGVVLRADEADFNMVTSDLALHGHVHVQIIKTTGSNSK